MPASDPVWFVTGCSTGFGRALAEKLIETGTRVVVTARNKDQVADIVEKGGDKALALALDVNKQDQIDAAVKATTDTFGSLDVLVNNAGYGFQSSIEEAAEQDIRDQFDANVFGLFAMTRAVLPVMRRQKYGRILNVTSVGGLIGFPSSGYYSATKHAVEGFSDALVAEAGPLGIKTTCIEPGPFRTDWAGRSLHQTQTRIADYEPTVGARLKQTSGYSGQQPGDPVRAADVMIKVVAMDEPPRHMVLGEFGYNAVTERMQKRLDEIKSLKDLSLSADFPKG